MKLFIGHSSALDYWSCHHPGACLPLRYANLDRCAWRASDIARFNLSSFNLEKGKLDVMVGETTMRSTCSWINYHVCKNSPPDGAFLRTRNDMYVASPEYAFDLVARHLTVVQAAILGYTLCGTYVSDPVSESGFSKREPLTSAFKIRRFLTALHGTQTRAISVKASRLITSNAASPMETAAAMLLSLPQRYGGYGLPAPLLNARIDLDSGMQHLAQRNFFVVDMLWPSAKLIVEYDSDMFHVGAERIERDALKRNVLTHLGYTTITLTRRQITNEALFNEVVDKLRIVLGKRKIIPSAKQLQTRQTLRSQLLGPSRLPSF